VCFKSVTNLGVNLYVVLDSFSNNKLIYLDSLTDCMSNYGQTIMDALPYAGVATMGLVILREVAKHFRDEIRRNIKSDLKLMEGARETDFPGYFAKLRRETKYLERWEAKFYWDEVLGQLDGIVQSEIEEALSDGGEIPTERPLYDLSQTYQKTVGKLGLPRRFRSHSFRYKVEGGSGHNVVQMPA
jgi:hypothetical protein|tara:strand:+ start:682 stop:1239 length:558 start_codon:yes stop_codon:yes gene_type:complete